MREKPVPLRVDMDVKPFDSPGPMEVVIQQEAVEAKESKVFDEQPDIPLKDLPSMVSIVPLNKPHGFDMNNIGVLQQQSFQFTSRSEVAGEFDFLEKDSVSDSQKQSVKFGVRVFRDWLSRQGPAFKSLEEMSRQEIANALEQFYLTAKRPNGSQYKKNTLKSIKHSLDLYLRSSPLKKDFSISSDFDFRQVNRTLENLPEDADNNRFPQCTKETILKLYKSGQLGLVSTEDPQVLIQTVWFYIASHFFSNIDKRMLRELTVSMLILSKDENGNEYYWLDYKTPEKCRVDGKARITANEGSICCPVATIKKYLEHRNPHNEVLFQHPKKINNTIWYSNLPLGKNKHMDIIKCMCVNAGVDPPLTGRCIRSYVQGLLKECDQLVNDMCRFGSAPNLPGAGSQAVLLPKTPANDGQPAQTHHITHGAPHFQLSQPVLGSSTGTSPVNTAMVQGNPCTPTPPGTATPTEVAAPTAYPTSHDGGQVVIPYRSSFPVVNGFTNGAQQELYNHYNGSSIAVNAAVSPTVASSMVAGSARYSYTNANQRTVGTAVEDEGINISKVTAEISTQTEQPNEREWSESAYNKADLKTRNKMRLQARKSLLSFLEELNEISDGHGTELFHEIVQEDMNMWKSIAGPILPK